MGNESKLSQLLANSITCETDCALKALHAATASHLLCMPPLQHDITVHAVQHKNMHSHP